ncbi:MAG TPA: hypothetical protein VHF01_07115 [Candidatus Acidoferrum sp.]|nr:hypothetical protein [Candidatus Acidoferrum sp.]
MKRGTLSDKPYSAKEEKRVLDALGRGLVREFPNPERAGCPGSDVLKRIAARTMPLAEAEKWLDHLGSCSPCYGDFSRFRKTYELRRRRTLLAVAASILIAAGIAGWVVFQKHNEALVSQTAVLDLRNRSVSRGTEPNPGEPPLEVKRGVSHLMLYLPLGSSEGPYEVRIVKGSGEILVTASDVAKLIDHITQLKVPVNISLAPPGSYVLQLRKFGSEWNSYTLLLR